MQRGEDLSYKKKKKNCYCNFEGAEGRGVGLKSGEKVLAKVSQVCVCGGGIIICPEFTIKQEKLSQRLYQIPDLAHCLMPIVGGCKLLPAKFTRHIGSFLIRGLFNSYTGLSTIAKFFFANHLYGFRLAVVGVICF